MTDKVEFTEENTENQAEEVETEERAEEKKETEKGSKKEINALKAELEAKTEEAKKAAEEAADAKDKYLRLAAEYDNFRKRSQKEKDGIYSDAVSDTVNEILPIFDNLERAAIYEDAQKVAEGLAITAKSIDQMLSKLKIERFGAVGDTFDPNLHNAVLHVEDAELGEGVIAEVFQTGYRLQDKIIRYAMVKVAN